MKIFEKKSAIDKYNQILRKKASIEDAISNKQREKDYKVQKIEKKYQSEIDSLLYDLDVVADEILLVQSYLKRHQLDN